MKNIFEEEKIRLTYTGFDRFITGGAMPVIKPTELR